MSDNKSDILSQSKTLFEKFGYQKTTLTDIARSVGKVKTAIYYYFSGKEEIFAQLVRAESETFLGKLMSTVLEEDDPDKQIELYIATRVRLMKKISTRYHFLKQEFFELMPIVEQNRKQADLKEIDFIEKIIERGNNRGLFNVNSSEYSAKMLVNTLKGLEIQMYVTDQIIIQEDNLKEFTTFLLYGLSPQKPK